RQGSSAVEQGTHKPLVGSSILPPGTPLLFLFGNVWRQVLFAPPDSSHETNPVLFFDHARPAVLIHITPTGEVPRLAGFRITLCWEKKKLHSFLHNPNLRYTLPFFVVENTRTEGAQISEFRRH